MNKETITMKEWQKEIRENHPVIRCFPKEQWAEVARFNGYLPLPPDNIMGGGK